VHDLTGGNTFVPNILREFWPSLDSGRLAAAAGRAASTLRRAAHLEASVGSPGDTITVVVRVVNLTGHKLPTGYPEGRRMWLTVTATDSSGDTVFSSGRYDPASGHLEHDPMIKVYESVHGMTDSAAAPYGLPPGPSFHFSLNDTILFDNRIPPRGFTNGNFLSRHAEPVGVTYADGEYWDDTEYRIPGNAVRIEAGLFYQTMSAEYALFLRDENAGNSFDWNGWGAKLYDAWEGGGRSSPVLMDSLHIDLPDTMTVDVSMNADLPGGFKLYQNYPNPFNATTLLRYRIGARGYVRIDLIDITGRHVRTLLRSTVEPGIHTLPLHADGLSSGIYIVRLTAGDFTGTSRILLLR
jgi:hypothetical protein